MRSRVGHAPTCGFLLAERQVKGDAGGQAATRRVQGRISLANEDVVAGRVLLVEDSMIIALDTEECLLQIGAAAVTVEGTVAGALEALATQDFAFALLDFTLGTDTGEPVAEALRTRGIPFWLATGYNEMADKLEQLGAQGLLTKPYGREDLMRIMREFAALRGGES